MTLEGTSSSLLVLYAFSEMEIDDGGSLIGRKIDMEVLDNSEKENCKSFHASVTHSDVGGHFFCCAPFF